MSESGTERLARDIEELLDSPQTELLNSLRDLIRNRIRNWALLFFAGLMIGYPLAGVAISWLVNQEQMVPDGVSIVVLQPLEIVILQIRLATHLAIAILALSIIADVAVAARRNDAIKQRLSQVDLPQISGFSTAFMALITAAILALAGIWYVLDFLLPLLLEYLHNDAESMGAVTTWQLSAWIGFIAGLCLGAVIGFQVPLVTLIALRGGLIPRAVLTHYRRHLWFGGFVAGAMLSPPDPLSMFLVSGPMLVLFEVSLVIDRILD